MVDLQTQNCGWGLRADADIRAGEFLVEYVGEGNANVNAVRSMMEQLSARLGTAFIHIF